MSSPTTAPRRGGAMGCARHRHAQHCPSRSPAGSGRGYRRGREAGLRFGVYSGGLIGTSPISTAHLSARGDDFDQGLAYNLYASLHMRDLIDRYQPDAVERHQLARLGKDGCLVAMSCSHTSTRITLTASSTTGGVSRTGTTGPASTRPDPRTSPSRLGGSPPESPRLQQSRERATRTDRPTVGLLSDGRRPGRPMAAQRRPPPRGKSRDSAGVLRSLGRWKAQVGDIMTAAQPVHERSRNRPTTRGCAGWKPRTTWSHSSIRRARPQ